MSANPRRPVAETTKDSFVDDRFGVDVDFDTGKIIDTPHNREAARAHADVRDALEAIDAQRGAPQIIDPPPAPNKVKQLAAAMKALGVRELNVASMICNPAPPRDYIYRGLSYVAGTYGLLHAPGNASKTYTTLEMLVTLALAGVPGCDYDPLRLDPAPAPGDTGWKVLYITGEDPDEEVWNRLHRIADACGPEGRATMRRNVRVLSTLGAPTRVTVDNEAFQQIVSARGAGCRLIVFDTLARFNPADEKDNTAMSGVVATFERSAMQTHASVLVLHHDNKAARAKDAAADACRGMGFRGAACIWDNARWSATIQPAHGGRALIEDKYNYGRQHDPRQLVWTDDPARGPFVAADPDPARSLVTRFDAQKKAVRAAEKKHVRKEAANAIV